MKFILGFLVSICFIVCLPSCRDEGPLLSNSDLKMVDTLYLEQVKLRKVELDSLCEQIYDHTFHNSKDSIKATRLEEIKGILGK